MTTPEQTDKNDNDNDNDTAIPRHVPSNPYNYTPEELLRPAGLRDNHHPLTDCCDPLKSQ